MSLLQRLDTWARTDEKYFDGEHQAEERIFGGYQGTAVYRQEHRFARRLEHFRVERSCWLVALAGRRHGRIAHMPGPAKPQPGTPYIHMDAMAFGMGCCCLQITFQAWNVDEARRVYDALVPVAPIMVSLPTAEMVNELIHGHHH